MAAHPRWAGRTGSRARRTGAVGVVLAGLSFVAACGTPTPRAAAPPHPVTLASITASTEASASFRFSISIQVLGMTNTTTGVVDRAHDASDFVMTSTGGQPSTPPEEVVTVGTTTWMGPIGSPAQWHQVPVGSAASADGGMDPSTLFQKLRTENVRLTYTGRATTDGAPTTEYRSTMTQPMPLPAILRAKIHGPVVAHGTGTISVDAQGRVRRLTQRITLSGSKALAMMFDSTATATFSGFDTPVTIAPPAGVPAATSAP